MDAQRKSSYKDERGLLRPVRPEPLLSIKTLEALEGLGDVLQGIHRRMKREGYEIVDGCVQKNTQPNE